MQFILYRHGLSIPPLKAAQDWSSNYHDGQGANCLSNKIRKDIFFKIHVILYAAFLSAIDSDKDRAEVESAVQSNNVVEETLKGL